MDEGTPAEVEVVCTEGRTVRPIRVRWSGAWLVLSDWDEARAGADVWIGEAVAGDGRRLALTFTRGHGGWRVRELSGSALPGGAGPVDPADWWRRRTTALWARRTSDPDED